MSIIRDRFNIDIRTGWSIERKTDTESEHFDNPNEYCMVDQYTDQFGNFLDCGVTQFDGDPGEYITVDHTNFHIGRRLKLFKWNDKKLEFEYQDGEDITNSYSGKDVLIKFHTEDLSEDACVWVMAVMRFIRMYGANVTIQSKWGRDLFYWFVYFAGAGRFFPNGREWNKWDVCGWTDGIFKENNWINCQGQIWNNYIDGEWENEPLNDLYMEPFFNKQMPLLKSINFESFSSVNDNSCARLFHITNETEYSEEDAGQYGAGGVGVIGMDDELWYRMNLYCAGGTMLCYSYHPVHPKDLNSKIEIAENILGVGDWSIIDESSSFNSI